MIKGKNSMVRLRHSLPGRMRIDVNTVPGIRRHWQTFHGRVRDLAGIEQADLRPITGSIILFYDHRSLGPKEIFEHVEQAIASSCRSIASGSIQRPVRPETSASCNNDSAVKTVHLFNVLALGGFLCFALIKRWVFKSPLSQRPLSLAGAIAAVSTIPLLYRSFRQVRDQKKFGLYLFLSIGCCLAILLGEVFAALEIIWLTALGMYTEAFVTDRARKTIERVLHVLPEEAHQWVDGQVSTKPIESLAPGITVVVYPGDPIPVDGTVLSGNAMVDEAHITGRSQPDMRQTGDWVYAGTRLVEGRLLIRADRLGDQTYLCRIRHMVDESLGRRAPIDKRADDLAQRLTRLGVVATVATFLVTRNLTRSFAVMLVMSCPCATVLAASTAIAAGIAAAARNHILVKGGLYLEQASKVNHICFDKTGTITDGVLQVERIVSLLPQDDGDEILQLAASAEAENKHPMAEALTREAHRRGLSLIATREYQNTIGRGVRARCGEDDILVGNKAHMQNASVEGFESHYQAREWMKAGATVLFVARNSQPWGMICLSNTWRASVPDVLAQLRQCGFENVSLISGDTQPVVVSLASDLGFDDYRAACLPEDKSRYVSLLEGHGQSVMMVGDGVNDALALSKASVGVAMGAGGSEVAIEAADIALLDNDLRSLVVIRRLSRHTMETIEQNFWLATSTNLIGVVTGAIGWMPTLMAGFLHVGHTLLILLNSSRILSWEDPDTPVMIHEPEADSGDKQGENRGGHKFR